MIRWWNIGRLEREQSAWLRPYEKWCRRHANKLMKFEGQSHTENVLQTYAVIIYMTGCSVLLQEEESAA